MHFLLGTGALLASAGDGARGATGAATVRTAKSDAVGRGSEMQHTVSMFAACMVALFSLSVARAQDGHGNGIEEATLLAIGPPQIGTIDGADDFDHYRIDLASSATVTVATAGPTDTRGELLDGNGALIASDEDSGPGAGNFQLTEALEAGVYYVAVSGSEGSYALTALLADAGDQGGTAASSSLLSLYGAAEVAGVTAIGSSALLSTVGSIDEAMTDLDYFRIDVPTGGTDVTVRSAGGTDTAGRLLDSALTEVAAEDGGDGNFRIEATLDAGTYYLEVMGETGRYRVIASGSDADCPCAGEAMALGDHGGTDETSTLMPIGPPLTGAIAGADDVDVFRIDLAGNATLTLEAAGQTDTMGVLRNATGDELAAADSGGPVMNFSITEELTPGVYYLAVSAPTDGGGAAGSYAVSAQLGGDSDHGDTAGLSTLLPLYSQDDVDNIKPSALLSTAATIDAAETDIDVFRLDVPQDMTDVTIRSAGTLDTFATLRDASLMELEVDDPANAGFRIEITLDAGVYYVEVGGHQTGRYRLLAWGDPRAGCSCAADQSNFALPMTGFAAVGLRHFDGVMQDFMAARGIPAGALAISRNGRTRYRRGFGWLDREGTHATPPDALFRLASVSKPITATAIQLLVAEEQLRLGDSVFCLSGPPCLLDIAPVGTPDPRTSAITVGHLLDHRGGWDQEMSGDPTFDEIEIADALGVRSPPGRHAIVRHVLGKPLDFDPGTKRAYSNFGYLLLGLVVERVAGVPFTQFVQDRIFAPIGVGAREIELGRSLPEDRNPREPWYSDTGFGRSVFDPERLVPRPDGTFHVEGSQGKSGLIASTPALLAFLNRYWISGHPRVRGEQYQFHFYGSLPGTFTFVWQRHDGVNVVALFNQRRDASGLDYRPDIRKVLGGAVDATHDW